MISRRDTLRGLAGVFGAAAGASLFEPSESTAAILPKMRVPPFSRKGIPARRIDREIAQAADEIEKRLSSLEKGRTLLVPVGERHTCPSHVVFELGLIEELKSRGHAVAVGLERPYNRMIEEDSPFRRLARASLKRAFDCDLHGRYSLMWDQANYDAVYARVSSGLFRHECLKQGISIRFTDLPAREDNSLMRRDSLTRYFMRMVSSAADGISALGKTGMHIRNLAIAQNAIDHAKDVQARVYIHPVGGAHLFGWSGKASYAQSLHAIWQGSGEAVLPIMLSSGTELPLSRAGLRAAKTARCLHIERLPDREFDYDDLSRRQKRALMRAEVRELAAMGRSRETLGEVLSARPVRRGELRRIMTLPPDCPEKSSLGDRVLNIRVGNGLRTPAIFQ